MTTVLILWCAAVQAADRYYSIQVGAYKTAERANKEVNTFKNKGLESFSRREPAGDKGMWYRVYIGKFTSKNSAATKAAQLKSDGLISDFDIKAIGLAEVSAPSDAASSAAASDAAPVKPRQTAPSASRTAAAVPGRTETQVLNGPAGWEMIVDLSGSTSDDYRCNGNTKYETIFPFSNTFIPRSLIGPNQRPLPN
ncbi:MAG: SPOR domain-containing protein, partial [Deltaproteobacteria bacterium]|nr:SPOR domain-containing protein [Deltaproteobacteria bacterium]